MKEKRVCENPSHPFKQSWYWFHPNFGQNDEFDEHNCSSCAHLMRYMQHFMEIAVSPHGTLYGHEYISLTREQVHSFVDIAFDAKEGL